MLLRFEDVLEGEAFLGLAGAEPDLELGLVAAQAIESHDLCQPGFHLPPAFGVNILAQATTYYFRVRAQNSIGRSIGTKTR